MALFWVISHGMTHLSVTLPWKKQPTTIFNRTPHPGQQLLAKLSKMWWVVSQSWVKLANLGFELSRCCQSRKVKCLVESKMSHLDCHMSQSRVSPKNLSRAQPWLLHCPPVSFLVHTVPRAIARFPPSQRLRRHLQLVVLPFAARWCRRAVWRCAMPSAAAVSTVTRWRGVSAGTSCARSTHATSRWASCRTLRLSGSFQTWCRPLAGPGDQPRVRHPVRFLLGWSHCVFVISSLGLATGARSGFPRDIWHLGDIWTSVANYHCDTGSGLHLRRLCQELDGQSVHLGRRCGSRRGTLVLPRCEWRLSSRDCGDEGHWDPMTSTSLSSVDGDGVADQFQDIARLVSGVVLPVLGIALLRYQPSGYCPSRPVETWMWPPGGSCGRSADAAAWVDQSPSRPCPAGPSCCHCVMCGGLRSPSDCPTVAIALGMMLVCSCVLHCVHGWMCFPCEDLVLERMQKHSK